MYNIFMYTDISILMIHNEILSKVALNTTTLTLTLCNPLSITVKLYMNLSCNITVYKLYMYLLLKILNIKPVHKKKE